MLVRGKIRCMYHHYNEVNNGPLHYILLDDMFCWLLQRTREMNFNHARVWNEELGRKWKDSQNGKFPWKKDMEMSALKYTGSVLTWSRMETRTQVNLASHAGFSVKMKICTAVKSTLCMDLLENSRNPSNTELQQHQKLAAKCTNKQTKGRKRRHRDLIRFDNCLCPRGRKREISY